MRTNGSSAFGRLSGVQFRKSLRRLRAHIGRPLRRKRDALLKRLYLAGRGRPLWTGTGMRRLNSRLRHLRRRHDTTELSGRSLARENPGVQRMILPDERAWKRPDSDTMIGEVSRTLQPPDALQAGPVDIVSLR